MRLRGRPDDPKKSLRPDHEYLVLGFSIGIRDVTFRVDDEEMAGSAWLADSKIVELTDATIPPNWDAELVGSGDISFEPVAWQRFLWPPGPSGGPWGFWEAYWGDVQGLGHQAAEKKARQLFAQEKAKMIASEPKAPQPRHADLRTEILRALVGGRLSPRPTASALGIFPWGSPPLVELNAPDVVRILDRFLAGDVDAAWVTDWANLVEVRDDIGLGPGVRDALFEMSTPEINAALDPTTVKALRDRLVGAWLCSFWKTISTRNGRASSSPMTRRSPS